MCDWVLTCNGKVRTVFTCDSKVCTTVLICDSKDDFDRSHPLPVDRFDQGDTAVDAVDAEEVAADGVGDAVPVCVCRHHLAENEPNINLVKMPGDHLPHRNI